VLVTNAGSIQVGPALAMRAKDFTNAMDLMFYGVLHPVLAALPVMQERGAGRILVISSIGGKLPAPHLLPYVAAKHAAVGFAEGLRTEVARHGISVTCAVPGLMRTGSPRNALFTGDQAAEHRWFTLGDSLPLVSMDAARAARQLVGATLKGRPEIATTPLAKIGMRVHGVAPSTTIRLVGLVNRLLPTDETPRPMRPGHAVEKPAKWFDALTGLTRRAARRYHQHTDSSPDPAPDPAPSTNP
jgi:short-subunit dehydrogenase